MRAAWASASNWPVGLSMSRPPDAIVAWAAEPRSPGEAHDPIPDDPPGVRRLGRGDFRRGPRPAAGGRDGRGDPPGLAGTPGDLLPRPGPDAGAAGGLRRAVRAA